MRLEYTGRTFGLSVHPQALLDYPSPQNPQSVRFCTARSLARSYEDLANPELILLVELSLPFAECGVLCEDGGAVEGSEGEGSGRSVRRFSQGSPVVLSQLGRAQQRASSQ